MKMDYNVLKQIYSCLIAFGKDYMGEYGDSYVFEELDVGMLEKLEKYVQIITSLITTNVSTGEEYCPGDMSLTDSKEEEREEGKKNVMDISPPSASSTHFLFGERQKKGRARDISEESKGDNDDDETNGAVLFNNFWAAIFKE